MIAWTLLPAAVLFLACALLPPIPPRRRRMSDAEADRVLNRMMGEIASDDSWRPRAERIRWLH